VADCDLDMTRLALVARNAEAEAAAIKIQTLQAAFDKLAIEKTGVEAALQAELRNIEDANAMLASRNTETAASLRTQIQSVEDLNLSLAYQAAATEAAELKLRELESAYSAIAAEKSAVELALMTELRALEIRNSSLAASNLERQHQIDTAAAVLSQQQEEMAALASSTAALQSALAAATESESAVRLAYAEREMQISAELRERICLAHEALRALGHPEADGGGVYEAQDGEVDDLTKALAAIRTAAGEVARWRVLASSIADREREFELKLDEALSEARDDIARYADMVDALEADLRAFATELAAREMLLGAASHEPVSISDVGVPADLLRKHPESENSAARYGGWLGQNDQKHVEHGSTLAGGLGRSLEADANEAPSGSIEYPRKQALERELERLRAERARLDDEVEALQIANQTLADRAARSVYWRMRDVTARLVARNRTTRRTQVDVERSTWPED
jgi:hypothetical protein